MRHNYVSTIANTPSQKVSSTRWNASHDLETNENFVTDAEKIVIGNTSGTNTGDQQPTVVTFVEGDLSANRQVIITHNLGYKYPAAYQVYDNSDNPVTGLALTPIDTTTARLNLIGLGTLTGTWRISVF